MKTFPTVVVLAVFTQPSVAQTVITRTDSFAGKTRISQGVVFKNGVEVWGFAYNYVNTADLELGYTPYSKGSWSLSGYVSNWPGTGQWWVLPWVSYSNKFAGGTLVVNASGYFPLTQGSKAFAFSDQSRLMFKAGRAYAGFAANYMGNMVLPGLQVEQKEKGVLYRLRFLQGAKASSSQLRFETRWSL